MLQARGLRLPRSTRVLSVAWYAILGLVRAWYLQWPRHPQASSVQSRYERHIIRFHLLYIPCRNDYDTTRTEFHASKRCSQTHMFHFFSRRDHSRAEGES